jgi:hypothetical protein
MSIGMGNNVNVGSTARVMAREQSLELGNAVRVGLLDTTQEGFVQVCGVIAVAVHVALDSRVDASGVAVPYVPVQVLDWLAGVDVDELAVDNDWDTSLAIAYVVADQLALYPEGSDFSLRGEDAGGVLGEEVCLWGVGSDLQGGVVRGVHDLVCIAGEDSSLLVGVEEGSTAGFGARVDPPTLQVVCTLVEASAGVLQKVPLGDLGVRAVVVGTGMGHSEASQGKKRNLGEMHCLSGEVWKLSVVRRNVSAV